MNRYSLAAVMLQVVRGLLKLVVVCAKLFWRTYDVLEREVV